MVPGALRVSPARPATSTSGAGDHGGASVVRPAAVLAGGKGGYWRMRGRKWCALWSRQAWPVLLWVLVWPTKSKKSVGHAPFISVSGTVLATGSSR